ncbi:MAG: hypothetical protein GEU28_07090 [Dehalococcoidia bacterium]|nr:hypothetical protein [Dehalococcoidia bacterium]
MAIRTITRILPGEFPTPSTGLLMAALVLLVPVALMAPFYLEPFERDEGVFATLAQAILHGELPYRDAWDHKPPLVATWYAGSFLLFGEGIEAPRIAASASAAATCLIVFLLLRRMFGDRTAFIGGLMLGLAYGIPYLQINANSEVFLMLPIVASLFSYWRYRESRSKGWLIAAGVLAGLAFMTKQVAIWNLFALCAFALIRPMEPGSRRSGLKEVATLVGTALAATLPFFVFFAAHGALGDFIYAIFTYNEMFAREIPIETRVLRMVMVEHLDLIPATSFLWAGAAVTVVRLMSKRKISDGHLLLLVWLAGSYLGVKTSGRDFPHYYVQLLPALAMLSALALSDFAAWFQRSRLPLAPVAGAIVLVVASSVGWNSRVYASGSLQQAHEEKFPDRTVTEADLEATEIARYIEMTTEPGDRIFNLGRESQLYFLADRLPATQFIYDRSFWLDEATFEHALRDLRANPPEIIVDSLSIELVGARADELPPRFKQFIKEHYEYAGELNYARIFRLKPTPSSFGGDLLSTSFSGVY